MWREKYKKVASPPRSVRTYQNKGYMGGDRVGSSPAARVTGGGEDMDGVEQEVVVL